MYIQIPYQIARQITDHAQENYPEEVCGLLAGAEKQITLAIPVENIADTPQTNYYMNPKQQLQALNHIETQQLEWLGVYHSHPKSHPIPSPTDIEDSVDPAFIHIIVSLKDSQPKLKAWQIQADHVLSIELLFDTQQPPSDAHAPLSNTQKTAIIATCILCVIVMLVISVTLLPPAPEITPIP